MHEGGDSSFWLFDHSCEQQETNLDIKGQTTENKKKSADEKNFIHPVTKTNHQFEHQQKYIP